MALWALNLSENIITHEYWYDVCTGYFQLPLKIQLEILFYVKWMSTLACIMCVVAYAENPRNVKF